jgi:hypothetical protein
MVHAQLASDGADAPFLDVIVAQDLHLEIRWDGHDTPLDVWSRPRPRQRRAGILCGPTASSVGHTSGSARTHPRRGMARQRRSKPPQAGRLRRPLRPSAHQHPNAAVGNPDALRSFVGHASDCYAPHGPRDRAGLPDSVRQPPAEPGAAPLARSLRHSKSDRGRNTCR